MLKNQLMLTKDTLVRQERLAQQNHSANSLCHGQIVIKKKLRKLIS